MNEETPAAEPKRSFRTFLILWITQSISGFGSALTFFCITVWLTQSLYPLAEQRPQLSAALSLLGLTGTIPFIFLAPIAGAWADRHDRRWTMIITNILMGIVSLALLWFVVTDQLALPLLIALVALLGIVGVFHGLAFETCYAMIVPQDMLPRANGMMQTMQAASNVLSPTAAALLLAMPGLARQGRLGFLNGALAPMKSGAPVAFAIDAVTFFAAGIALLFLVIPSPKRRDLTAASGKKKSMWADVAEGATYIWHRKPLLMLLALFAVSNFVGSFTGVFHPLMLKFVLAPDWQAKGFTYESALATTNTVATVGMLIGGIIVSTWGGLRAKRVYGVVIPMAVSMVAFAVYGMSTALYLTAAMGFVRAFTMPILNAHSQAIWQSQVSVELQGRVFSVRRLIAQCTAPISVAIAGWLGGRANPGAVIVALGVFGTVVVTLQLANPRMLRVEDKEWVESQALESQARSAKA